MAVTFPDHPDLIGGYAPLQIESDTASLRIEGEIPHPTDAQVSLSSVRCLHDRRRPATPITGRGCATAESPQIC